MLIATLFIKLPSLISYKRLNEIAF